MYEQSGGFFDWMNKGDIPAQDIDESIQFIILIGILLVIINAFTKACHFFSNFECCDIFFMGFNLSTCIKITQRAFSFFLTNSLVNFCR